MKVYISVDIEGVTGVTNWDETELNHPDHKAAALQMTKEIPAVADILHTLPYRMQYMHL